MIDENEKRIAKIEARQDVQDHRLISGNDRFSAQERRLEKLEETKLGPSFWAKVLVPFVLAAGGWIYSIAQMPNRSEVRTMVMQDSPWLTERGTVLRIVNSYDQDKKEARDALQEIRENLAAISSQLDVVIKKRKSR